MNELIIEPVNRTLDVEVVHVESVYTYLTPYQIEGGSKLRD